MKKLLAIFVLIWTSYSGDIEGLSELLNKLSTHSDVKVIEMVPGYQNMTVKAIIGYERRPSEPRF